MTETIPEGWDEDLLLEICKVYQPSNLSSKDIREEGKYLVYGANGIIGYYEKYNEENEEVLLTCRGSTCGTINKSKPKSWVTANAMVIRPIKKASKNYVYYYFQNYDFKKVISGAAQPQITRTSLKNVKILLPPIPEQEKIADILSKTDDQIQLTEEIIAKTEELKKGLMQELLTKGIGHTEFKETELGRIPKEWEVKILDEVADFKNGKAHEKFIDEKGEFIVVNSKFISTEGKVVKKTLENICPVKKGDILMVMSDVPNGKAIAKCFYVDENEKYSLNQRICSLTSKRIESKFLFYVINRNRYYLKFDDGIQQTNLRKDQVLKCPVQIPSFEEQKSIVQILSQVDKQLFVEINELTKLLQLKKGLMQDLLTGKVRVKV